VLSHDLVWNLDLDVSLVWDRNETPRQESDGTRPKRDDFRLTVGFGWDF
jgi:long-subunit fatty acid transport protein